MRDRLLDAAEQVVARDGVASLTLDAVAREAGVSKGGLLYHFPTKSSLIMAVVERLAVHCEAEHASAMAQQSVGPGAFARAYIAARSQPLDPQEKPIHTALLAAAGTDPHYLDPFRERAAYWQTQLASDGLDPAHAMIVRLAMDGLCLDNLLGLPVPEGDLRERVISALVRMTHTPAGSTACAQPRAASRARKRRAESIDAAQASHGVRAK